MVVQVPPQYAILPEGIYEEAERFCARAVAIGEKALGPYHPSVATWLSNGAGLSEIQVSRIMLCGLAGSTAFTGEVSSSLVCASLNSPVLS
ncbi:unnamed protein product [Ectocarpus sp. 13 AM-2016]